MNIIKITFLGILLTWFGLSIAGADSKKLNYFSENLLDAQKREVVTPDGLNAQRVENTIFFYNEGKIKTYDLELNSWGVSYESLSANTTAFVVHEGVVYTAQDNQIFKHLNNVASPEMIFTSSEDVHDLLVVNEHLLIVSPEQFLTLSLIDEMVVDSKPYSSGIAGSLQVDSRNKVFFADTNVIPQDIASILVNDDGTITYGGESPYHGSYPISEKMYSFPNGNRVADGSGVIYHTMDLEYAGNLGDSFDHLEFYLDLPIVLRGDRIYAYDNVMQESSYYDLPGNVDLLFVYEDTLYLFKYDTVNVEVDSLDISVLGVLNPDEAINPEGLVYTIDESEYNDFNSIYLLSRDHLRIFEYNASTMSYEGSIELNDAPFHMAHSPYHNRIYLGYSDNTMTYIDLDSGEEVSYLMFDSRICGFEMADNYLFVCWGGGTWNNYNTYNQDGVLISEMDWRYRSMEFHWNSQNRKMYHFRDGTSPNDLIWSDIGISGIIGESFDSPYHGAAAVYPICVNPNGLNVVLGTGRVFDALSLEHIDELGNEIKKCAWSRGQLFTIDDVAGSYLQSWDENMVLTEVGNWSGEPIDLVGLNSGALLVIHEDQGVPQFDIMNDEIFASSFD